MAPKKRNNFAVFFFFSCKTVGSTVTSAVLLKCQITAWGKLPLMEVSCFKNCCCHCLSHQQNKEKCKTDVCRDMFFHCLGVAFPLRYFCCVLKMKCGRNPINGSYIINLEHVSSKYIALKGRLICATEVASAAKCLGDHGLQNAKVNQKKEHVLDIGIYLADTNTFFFFLSGKGKSVCFRIIFLRRKCIPGGTGKALREKNPLLPVGIKPVSVARNESLIIC